MSGLGWVGLLGIDFKPKSNDARHAFATQLKRAGKSSEFIRELIGHERASTTQDYLDDFEDDTKQGIAEQLLPFRKNIFSVADEGFE